MTDDDRYTGSKKYKSHKSTKPRFYDGELQIMKRKLKLFMKINWTLFRVSSVKVNKFFRILRTVFLALTIDICGLLTSIFRDACALSSAMKRHQKSEF